MTKTAERRREESRAEYNAFMAACPTRQVIATLADKWAALTVAALGEGPMRHSELMRRIAGASQKMLTQTLRTLERDGLVTRTITPSVPVRVDYELTDLGRGLLPILGGLKVWAEGHMTEILEAREQYDERVDQQAG